MLLRSGIGLAVLLQGVAYLTSRGPSATEISLAGTLGVLTGLSLLIGFLTPLTAVIAGLGAVAIQISWLPAPLPSLSSGWLSIFLLIIIAASIVLLGPGSFSVDARLFGRREIIIPHPSGSQKE